MRTWLIKIRKALGLTIKEAAAKSEISKTMYHYIESGERGAKLPVGTAKKIAAAFGFDWRGSMRTTGRGRRNENPEKKPRVRISYKPS